MMPKPLAVVFDMDGVIIDSHPAHVQAWRLLLEGEGRNPTDADLEYVYDGGKRDDIVRHFFGAGLTQEQLTSYGDAKGRLFDALAPTIGTIAGVMNLLGELESAGI